MSLKRKLTIIIAVCVLILSLFIGFYMVRQSSNLIERNEEEQYEFVINTVQDRFQQQLGEAELSAQNIANNQEIQRLFAERDREALREMLLSSYEAIEDDFAQWQFHLPDSTSFLRLHAPDNYGDSLRDFRHTVNEANQIQEAIVGLEEGRGGYGFRAVVPMFYEGEHTGTVEFGSEFGVAFLESLQDSLSGEYFIYTLGDGVAWEDDENNNDNRLAATTDEDPWELDDQAIDRVREGEELIELIDGGAYSVLLIPIHDYADQVRGYIKVVRDRGEVLSRLSNIRRNTYISVFLGLIVILAIIFKFLDHSLSPLERMVKNMESVKDGDLTTRLQVDSDDEIGKLATVFNEMVEQLQEMVLNLLDTVEELSAYSEELSASAEEGDATVDVVNSNIQDVTSSIEEVSASSQEVSSIAQETDQLAAEGGEKIKQAVTNIEDINSTVEETVTVIENLDSNSREIGQIIELINDIAEQTNLLALNAAIEAARAGEHGRGFAVVAEEIRELAGQTGKATDKIAKLIKEIQSSSDLGLESVQEANAKTKAGKEIVEETGQTFASIESSIENTSVAIQQIASGAQELAGRSNKIMDSSEDIAGMSSEISNSAQELAEMAQELQSLIQRFDV
ncbi:methyl-accepting chemotaxis protein [Fuchsiella alkaliacetigena]|uniref:methyl-accepting chemotaxis protein n=1 Tax=Fuchsiella alkaliacetigena TaxID=957042 RepID=UPI00200AEB72|nr:methyl-accepting chemotaxis protein [Fuchsiella alkaliacetigena]MCK8826074.1 methyl-accepting chemotaxis protein [Fuchsiella alkaliacetigena]